MGLPGFCDSSQPPSRTLPRVGEGGWSVRDPSCVDAKYAFKRNGNAEGADSDTSHCVPNTVAHTITIPRTSVGWGAPSSPRCRLRQSTKKYFFSPCVMQPNRSMRSVSKSVDECSKVPLLMTVIDCLKVHRRSLSIFQHPKPMCSMKPVLLTR